MNVTIRVTEQVIHETTVEPDSTDRHELEDAFCQRVSDGTVTERHIEVLNIRGTGGDGVIRGDGRAPLPQMPTQDAAPQHRPRHRRRGRVALPALPHHRPHPPRRQETATMSRAGALSLTARRPRR